MKDPAEDRDEFIKRLKELFDPFRMFDANMCILKILQEDKEYKEKFLEKNAEMESKIQKYLSAYDVAATKEEKMKVVGSVHL